RKEFDRGLEPDECYWIAHEQEMRCKTTYDADIDPPPDLVLEIALHRSPMKRVGILATLGVPEVWRYDGRILQILLLNHQGEYEPSDVSRTIPMLRVCELARFLELRHTQGENELIRAFRDSIQHQEAANLPTTAPHTRKKK